MATLYNFRNGFTRKAFSRLFTILLVIGIVVVLLFFVIQNLFQIDLSFLFTRWEDFGTLKDSSTMIRVFDIRRIAGNIENSPLIGYGMGALVFTDTMARYFAFMDNSYLMLLFKGGIPYLMISLLIYFTGISRAWIVYRKSPDVDDKMIGAALLSILTAVLINGFASTILVYYRYIIISMLIVATATTFYLAISKRSDQLQSGENQ